MIGQHLGLPPPPSDAVRGWAGWALAHPEFGVSVNQARGQISMLTLFAHPELKA